jgi:ribosomal protein L31E
MNVKISEEEEEEELPQLIVSQEVNEKIWGRGIEKPPRKIKTRVTKDSDGNVTVFLAENQ